jgi:uncharacterized protein Yka (UPF0111/DUF47 family)
MADRRSVQDQLIDVLVALEKADLGWARLVSDLMEEMGAKMETLMNGRDAYFVNLQKKLDELHGMLSQRPIGLSVDDHVKTACLVHGMTKSLMDIESRADDADRKILDKMDGMAEWAVFKVLRTRLYEVIDQVTDKTFDEIKDVASKARVAIDMSAVDESGGRSRAWVARALGEVADPDEDDDDDDVIREGDGQPSQSPAASTTR